MKFLGSSGTQVQLTQETSSTNPPTQGNNNRQNRQSMYPAIDPVSIDPGAPIDVSEVGLWIMGSRGPDNEYLSCGGVRFG